MSAEPTNQVLLEKINNVHREVVLLRDEFRKVDRQVARNTAFRNQVTGALILVSAIGITNLFLVLKLFL